MTSSYTILLLFQVQIHSTIIFISILSKRLNIILSSAYRRPIIVVFSVTIIFAKFRRGPPLTIGCRWDEKIVILINISLYLRNDTKYGHIYYGMRIGNRTQGFEWYNFQ